MAANTPGTPGRPRDSRAPVLEPGHTYGSVTDQISSIVLTRGLQLGWMVGFGDRPSRWSCC